jgi:pilus assembly protein CpaB
VALVVALVLGLAAAKGASVYMRRAVESEVKSRAADTRPLGEIVIAIRDLPVSSKIVAEDLALMKVPEETIAPSAIRSTDEALGRITRIKMWAGETLLEPKLAPKGSRGGLQAVIPDGYRAMTLKVNDSSGVSGFVQPGAHVDVVAVIKPQTRQEMPPTAKVILQNVEVLAVGSTIDSAEEGTAAKAGKTATATKSATTATLLVTPSDAERLALADNQGEISLIMRAFADEALVQTPGVDPTGLVSRPVVGTAPLRQSVEVIAGSMKSSQSVAKVPEPRTTPQIVDVPKNN